MSPTWMLRVSEQWVPSTGGALPPPVTNLAPSAPGSLSASPSSSSIALSWTAATDPDGTVANYEVRVGGVLVASPAGLTYTITGLSSGATYQIAVNAVDNNGLAGPAATRSSTTTTVSVAHGRDISAANTGHTAYLDPALGRTVVDSDLVVHTGLMSVSDLVSNGGTLTKHWFKGGLIFDRSNVTFTACKFDGGVSGYYAGVHYPFALNWCTIDTPGAAGDDGINFQDYSAYRCRIGGCSDGMKTNGNVTLTECYIRTKGQDAADHNDGTQNVGGLGPVNVVRCNVDCRPTNGLGAPNAALFAANACEGLQTWTDNWCAGGGYVLRLYENATYDVQGNDVLDASWVFGPVARAVIPATNVTWGTIRPNRIVGAAGALVSTLSAP